METLAKAGAWILQTVVPVILGWFGYAPKATKTPAALDVQREAGRLETENAQLRDIVHTQQRVEDAADRVDTSPDSVYSDPDNRNNPSSPHYRGPGQRQ